MKNKSFNFITLGCPKNIVDSESMAALLMEAGMVESIASREADVIIINTCCFIESAKEEAIQTILEAVRLKEETGGFLVVVGCFPQRYKDELADELPEVDSWMGLEDLKAVTKVVEETLKGKNIRKFYEETPIHFQYLPRYLGDMGSYSYLKIAEGCSHNCSFCVIPSIRGKYRSLPLEKVEERAKFLVKQGKKEILLIAQDTGLYGYDLYNKPKLDELLKRLADIEGLNWIRLMYTHPSTLTDKILKTIGEEKKICNYVDIPLQHSHPYVLKKMGRPYNEKFTRGIVEKIKKYVPNSVIRTAFIVGHPGETEKSFLHLVEYVKEMEFYNMGVFTFSPEEGTESYQYKTRPSKIEAKRRRDYLMEIQREVACKLRKNLINKEVPAICESVIKEDLAESQGVMIHLEADYMTESSIIPKGAKAIGRTIYDAPEIDSLLYIKGNSLAPGTFFNAIIDDSSGYDLIATPKS